MTRVKAELHQVEGAVFVEPPGTLRRAAGRRPKPWRATWRDWDLELRFVIGGQGVRCVGLSIEAKPDVHPRPSLTSRVLRDIPVAALGREWAQSRAEALRAEGRLAGAAVADQQRRLTQRELKDKHYRDVSAVYLAAVENGEPPTRAVARAWQVNAGQAATWVKRARERGHLPPAPGQGRAGFREDDE